MRQVLAFVALMALAGSASGQAVYRCVEKGKPVAFQTEPCDTKAKTTAVRGYVPDPTPTTNELAWKRYNTEREMAARNRNARAGAGVAVTVTIGGGECAAAKAARDDWERRVGLNRSVDGLRYWQDYVAKACR